MNLKDFNPNDPAMSGSNMFGLPFNTDNSKMILIPVPWEATVSYRTGTSQGPEKIKQASLQVDLFDRQYQNQWQKGISMLDEDEGIKKLNNETREKVEKILDQLYDGEKIDQEILTEINKASTYLNQWLENISDELISKNKLIALVGGDHSTPLGIIKSLSKKYENFGILQIDAHADLRKAYEGFIYSHASIMYNVLNEIKAVTKLVQIGIRDYCDEEYELITNNTERIKTFFDEDLKKAQFQGKSWDSICLDIINELPQKVYISFDIDGLKPELCPNTGTPVPGGFEMEEIIYLFEKINQAGKKIIGFDFNETANDGSEEDTIDTITASRIIYKLSNIILSQN